MSEPLDDRLDAEIREALAEERSPPDEHPEPDVLLAYYERTLSEARAEAVREHLAECEECADAVLDFAAFPDLEPSAEEPGLTPAEVQRDWSALQARVAAEGPPWRRWAEYAALPAAAVFLLVAVGLGAWGVGLRSALHEATGPNGNALVIQPYAESTPRGDRAAAPALPGDVEVVVLVFEAPAGERSGSYTVDLRAGSGTAVVLGESVRANPEGLFTLTVPGDDLAPGTYRLDLYGERGGERVLLRELAFDVGS